MLTNEAIETARSELRQFFAAQNEITTAHQEGRLQRIAFLMKAKSLRETLSERSYWANMAIAEGCNLCALLDVDSTTQRERAAFTMLDTYAKIGGLE